MREVTITVTATTAPNSAERTGAASRPVREPSAERMPSTALGGRPAVAAAFHTESRSGTAALCANRCGATR
ncbi:MAG: hypothetical protein ABSG39_01210 [Acidimicrobiales bacterium]